MANEIRTCDSSVRPIESLVLHGVRIHRNRYATLPHKFVFVSNKEFKSTMESNILIYCVKEVKRKN
jgi:hypothetical protein